MDLPYLRPPLDCHSPWLRRAAYIARARRHALIRSGNCRYLDDSLFIQLEQDAISARMELKILQDCEQYGDFGFGLFDEHDQLHSAAWGTTATLALIVDVLRQQLQEDRMRQDANRAVREAAMLMEACLSKKNIRSISPLRL